MTIEWNHGEIMLVLTRKSEEKIIIEDEEGDSIAITVLKIQGGKVSLGIQANKKKYVILREELCSKEDSVVKELETVTADY